jgi:hypothetical protein
VNLKFDAYQTILLKILRWRHIKLTRTNSDKYAKRAIQVMRVW